MILKSELRFKEKPLYNLKFQIEGNYYSNACIIWLEGILETKRTVCLSPIFSSLYLICKLSIR